MLKSACKYYGGFFPTGASRRRKSEFTGNAAGPIGCISQAGNLEVRTYSDYYPYGMVIQGLPNSYRYGYQGQYSEKDAETDWNAFELRMYDSRVARWLTMDPKGEFHSPYLGMGNSPTGTTDPDGGSTDDIIFRGTDNKEFRVKAAGPDVYVDVPFEIKQNQTLNIPNFSNLDVSRFAAGFTINASVGFGVYYGGDYSGELSVVRFFNNDYGNYNYVYAGGSTSNSLGNRLNASASLGGSIFLAVNTANKPNFNPQEFAGQTFFSGYSADAKFEAGGGINAQFFWMESGWKGLSIGASLGVGYGVNAGSAFKGQSYSILLNNVHKTNDRSLLDRSFNFFNPTGSAVGQYLMK